MTYKEIDISIIIKIASNNRVTRGFFATFLITLISSYAASCQNRDVQILEPKRIADTLLHLLSRGVQSKDSCATLYVHKRDNTVLFDYLAVTHKTVNLSITAAKFRKQNYGYFKFEHVNFFVFGSKDLFTFFKKTKAFKSFTYINLLGNKHEVPILSDLENMAFYKYKNGKFEIVP